MNFDCVIAGAGPAASACALILRQAGLTVCLVSPQHPAQASKPRSTIEPNRLPTQDLAHCHQPSQYHFTVGESLPGAAKPLLNRLGIDSLSDVLSEREFSLCAGNASAWGSEQWQRMDAVQNPQGGGWHIDRTAFDLALNKQMLRADVTWLQGKVMKAEYKSHWLLKLDQISETISCRYLIDATGRASALSKLVGIKKQHLDQQMAAVGWFESFAQDKEQVTRIKAVNDGWWYSARLPNRSPNDLPIRVIAKFALPADCKLSIQAGGFVSQLNDSNLMPVRFGEEQLMAPLQLKDASVSKLSQFSDAERRFLAVGDAVLSFDPLSSQGLFFAMYSGIKAAETIAENHSATDVDFASYDTVIGSVLAANQKSRKWYYASEHRFADNEFWRSRVL